MKFSLKQKLAAAGLVTAVTLGGGLAAFAFWSQDSTGSGTASTGSQSGNHVTGSNAAGALSPSSSPQNLTASVTNASPHDEAVPTVTVSFTVTKDPNNQASGSCDNSNYVLSPANGVMTPADNTTLASGGSRSYSGVSINYVNSASVNQDACQGATVNLTYTAS
jgi:hypothetical protein